MVHVAVGSIGTTLTGSSDRTYAMETDNLPLKIYICMELQGGLHKKTAYSYDTNHAGHLTWTFLELWPEESCGR